MIGILLASTSTEGHGQSAPVWFGNKTTRADTFTFACHGNIILTAPFTRR
jgi:hypothetical protein